MDYNTSGARTNKQATIGLAIVVGMTTIATVFASPSFSVSTTRVEPGRIHQTLSQFEAETENIACAKCAAEAAAYAATLANLEAAQKAADEAYDAWYSCVYPGPGPTPTREGNTDSPALVSILEN